MVMNKLPLSNTDLTVKSGKRSLTKAYFLRSL